MVVTHTSVIPTPLYNTSEEHTKSSTEYEDFV